VAIGRDKIVQTPLYLSLPSINRTLGRPVPCRIHGNTGTNSRPASQLVHWNKIGRRRSAYGLLPALELRVNQDCLVTENWDIGRQTWLFLAVCDGKCLSHASQRTQFAFHVQAMVELQQPSIQPGPFLDAYVQRCVITPRCLAQIQ